jgi:hypothetical protein
MSSKRIEIFEKASNQLKKASNSLKISLKFHAFFKKNALYSQKIKPRGNCPNGKSTPVFISFYSA